MKTYAVRLDVLCASRDSAVAYIEELHAAVVSGQLRLPPDYRMSEFSIVEGEWDPNAAPGKRVARVTVVKAASQ